MQNLSSFRRPNTNKSMGIEWELIDTEYVSEYGEYYGFFKATRDGSISRAYSQSGNGVEFVSQPLSAQWLKKELIRLNNKMQKRADGNRVSWAPGDTHPCWMAYNESCGIHIHVSRKWCTIEKAKNIYAWLQLMADGEPSLYEDMFGRKPNDYCQVGPEFGSSRYLAVNNENKATVEFRMFSSGTVHWACKCVDTVEWLINNHDHLNVDAAAAFCDL